MGTGCERAGQGVGDLITPAADDNASRFRLFADVVEVLRGASAENGLLVVLDHQPRRRRNPYNTRQPADDVANNLGPWSQLLEKGGYSPAEAKEAALQFLPDILRFDRTNPWATPTDGS